MQVHRSCMANNNATAQSDPINYITWSWGCKNTEFRQYMGYICCRSWRSLQYICIANRPTQYLPPLSPAPRRGTTLMRPFKYSALMCFWCACDKSKFLIISCDCISILSALKRSTHTHCKCHSCTYHCVSFSPLHSLLTSDNNFSSSADNGAVKYALTAWEKKTKVIGDPITMPKNCLLYTSPSPRD